MELFDRFLQWLRRQRIGAELLPTSVRVLTINVGLTAAVIGAIAVSYRIPGAQAVSILLLHAFLQVGIVTAIFLAAQQRRTFGTPNGCNRSVPQAPAYVPSPQRVLISRW